MTLPTTDARTGGNDAVAFTSGPQGAPFSAGVVHAWLAADREKPLVATGISMGTFAAAAMRRVYEELEHQDGEDLEVKRWRWYQRYYDAITDNPMGPLWQALPDPVDFFAGTPPAQDPSVPSELHNESENARRHYYLLTKLGVWLANLPVRVSTIATLLVMYVRRTENYGVKSLSWLSFFWNLCIAVLGILFHFIRSPQWILEGAFRSTPARKIVRPLLGWPFYLLVVLLPLLTACVLALAGWGLYWALGFLVLAGWLRWLLVPLLIAGSLFVLDQYKLASFLSSGKPEKKRPQTKKHPWWRTVALSVVSGRLDIAQGLLHPYQIKRAIYDLFVKGAPDFVLKGPEPNAVKALFVCAALEETSQIVLKEEMPVIDALTAAVSVPGLLPPQRVPRDWIASKTKTLPASFQVIDGAAVRTNPLPAFFDWCKWLDGKAVAEHLEREDGVTPSLHMVYSVPTGYDGSLQEAPGIDCPDIVLSAQKAMQLAKRRDTRQEVRQTNNLSRLEWHRRLLDSHSRKTLFILADEIAPREEIDLGNELSPDHEMLRRVVADGCRGTLETLYREDIRVLRNGDPTVPCAKLLRCIAPRRAGAIEKCGGLHAVCDRCTRVLEYRAAPNPEGVQDGVLRTYGLRKQPSARELTEMFPQLAKDSSKVVFLGSGGVFRGAFHIGVLAAMYKAELFPDLVIGASVGTLMGGALCRMTAGDPAQAPQVLADLTELFTHVDEKVSLTFTLKNAAKQLGIRAREIRLSPAELARKVRLGSKADPGYAATGAPPVLTDALSSLFTIPHRNTAAITSQFVAGHFSTAIAQFLREVRRETLTSFDIQRCVMGVSLLEGETKRLLAFCQRGSELGSVQPYQGATPSGRKVAFFATTSFLNAGSSLLLGRDFLSTVPSWSAIEEGLCSSAFPAVFAARTEADLMPGAGRADRFFADGGMFDNLPFFPAVEILSAVQHAVPFANAVELQARLQARVADPDLIIAAGLNEEPVPDEKVESDTVFAVRARAATLSYGSKTCTFTTSANKSLAILHEIATRDLSVLNRGQQEFLNSYVAGTIVNITPTDADHINPTFAFCKSLKMRSKRVQASIGDGCYRSLEQFSRDKRVQEKLQASNKTVTWIEPVQRQKSAAANVCPYFRISGAPVTCPFTETNSDEAKSVFDICRSDPAHP